MIYVLDEVTLKPGDIRAFADHYMRDYAPAARKRGMTLVNTWCAPAAEFKDLPNTFIAMWTIPDAPSWWGMRNRAAGDPGVKAFWDGVDERALSRSRRFMTSLGEEAKEAADV